MNVAIITEAHSKIGTGHLVESLNLAHYLSKVGLDVALWVNEGAPGSLTDNYFYASIHSYLRFADELDQILQKMQNKGVRVVLFDLRRINNDVLNTFNRYFKLVCIDELGRRRLDCDAIINPLMVNEYHKYWAGDGRPSPALFMGPAYFIISEGIARANKAERVFNNSIKTISVCMGGVDRTGATFRIIDVLAKWKDHVIKNIILGAGFESVREIREKLENLSGKNFCLFHGIDNIEDYYLASDVVFSAGGNTLYELACTGTPALVLYEDEHEKENGLAFAGMGFGYCLGPGISCEPELIWGHLDLFEPVEMRQRHSNTGKRLVDGEGNARIADLLKKMIDDIPIQNLS